MATVNPVTDADRATVLELHAEGLSRNEIARRLGRSGRTISRIVEVNGGTFDRAAWTNTATKTKQADNRARRAELERLFLEDAHKLRKQLWEPAVISNFGGKDNTYNEHEVPRPLFADQLKIMQAATIAADKSLKLADHDNDNGVDNAKSMIGELFAGLAAAVDAEDTAAAEATTK